MAHVFALPYIAARHVESEHISHEVRTFEGTDAKGRSLGYSVSINRNVYAADPESSYGIHESKIGEAFEVAPQALRDGKRFGALPVKAFRTVRTLAEAQALVEPMFARAAKAAAKLRT